MGFEEPLHGDEKSLAWCGKVVESGSGKGKEGKPGLRKLEVGTERADVVPEWARK